MNIMNFTRSFWILFVFSAFVGGNEGCVKSVEMVEHIRTVTSNHMNDDIESVTETYYVDVVICCDGYLKNPTTDECEPFCSDCLNGICTLGVCVCNEGYEFNLESNRCEPLCTICLNGVCSAPEVCTCNGGYVLHETEPNVCQPLCENCSRGRCTQPGLCVCDQGFERDQTLQLCIPTTTPSSHANLCGAGYAYYPDTGVCEPICEHACYGGICVGPNLCNCSDGFEWSGTSGRCERACELGYRLRNETDECVPKCESDSCLNANCSTEGTCLCFNGHEFINGSLTECQPICNPPCVNSNCKAPQTCDVEENTDSIENSTDVDENSRIFVNLTCLPHYNCSCPDGFYFNVEGATICAPNSRNEWVFILITVVPIGAILLLAAIIGYKMVHTKRRSGTVSVPHKRDTCFRYSPGKNNIEEYSRESFV